MRLFCIFGAVIGTCMLGGCGSPLFVNPQTNPVITSNLGQDGGQPKIVSLATTAERRNIYVNVKNGRVCYEPPPDAAEAISANFTAALQASGGQGGTAGASIGNSISTAVASLSKRSQGVILFRDYAFNLCVAYINGEIDGMGYMTAIQQIFHEILPIIQVEIEKTNGQIGPPTSVTTTVTSPTNPSPSGEALSTSSQTSTTTTTGKHAPTPAPQTPPAAQF
jgi:hypothetical protein